jgi:hypothetical protein
MTKNWDIFPPAEPSTEDLANFSAYQVYNKFAIAGYGVLTGCVTSWTSTTRVDISSGTYTNNGAPRNLSASYISSITAASAGEHRYDLIYIDGADDTVKILAGTAGTPDDALTFLENYTPRPAEPTDTDWIPLAIIRVTENGLEESNFGTVVYATKSVANIRVASGFTVDDSTIQIVNGVISIKSDTVTKLDDLAAPDANTDLNATSTKHGLCPQLSNSATQYLSGAGTWTAPTPDHTTLGSKGTNTHTQIDTFISSKAAVSGLASLDGSSKVVQDPANATTTATASKIPIADGTGKLAAAWIPDISATYATAAKGVTNGGGDGAAILAAATSFVATAKVLGRKTTGAGAGEECSLSELIDLLGTAEIGDIIERGASTWSLVHHGVANQLYKCGGHGVANSWSTDTRIANINIGDGVSVIATGEAAGFKIPISGHITVAELTSLDNTSGAISVQVWKKSYAGGVPVAADIVDTFTIGLGNVQSTETLSPSLAVTAGDRIVLNVNSVSSLKLVLVALTIEGV